MYSWYFPGHKALMNINWKKSFLIHFSWTIDMFLCEKNCMPLCHKHVSIFLLGSSSFISRIVISPHIVVIIRKKSWIIFFLQFFESVSKRLIIWGKNSFWNIRFQIVVRKRKNCNLEWFSRHKNYIINSYIFQWIERKKLWIKYWFLQFKLYHPTCLFQIIDSILFRE